MIEFIAIAECRIKKWNVAGPCFRVCGARQVAAAD